MTKLFGAKSHSENVDNKKGVGYKITDRDKFVD